MTDEKDVHDAGHVKQALKPRYYFRLADGHLVTNYGGHELADSTAAQIAAIELARSVRKDRPELIGQGYNITVSDELGSGVCVIPLEIP